MVAETAEAHSIRFDVPEELRETFKFRPGQHLTLKAEIGGEEVRRNYSLCVAPQDGAGDGHRQADRRRRSSPTGRTTI